MGEREFATSTAVLRDTGYLGPIRVFIGVACIILGLLSAVEQFHSIQPLGPHGVVARSVHLALLISAVCVGVVWLARPWPGYRWAMVFVGWGDVALAASAAVLTAPEARLAGTVYMCLLGVFAAVFLGYRVLGLHCLFATAVIAMFTWTGVRWDGATVADLSVYFLPAMTTVVVMPVIAAVAIQGTRTGLRATADVANRDPLTGLLNRRGLYATTDAILARSQTGTLLVVAVIDLDGFKRFNDDHGHPSGDALLRAAADQLTKAVRSEDIAARIGGDEFVLVAAIPNRSDLDSFVERVRSLNLHDAQGLSLRCSIGVAWEPVSGSRPQLDLILRRADEAMYRAKRVGGGDTVVAGPLSA